VKPTFGAPTFYIRLPYKVRAEKEGFCVTNAKASVGEVGSRGHISKLKSDVGQAEPFSSGEFPSPQSPANRPPYVACCESPKVPSVPTLRV